MSDTEVSEIQRALGRLEASMQQLLQSHNERSDIDRRYDTRLTRLEHWKIGFTAALGGASVVIGFLWATLWRVMEFRK